MLENEKAYLTLPLPESCGACRFLVAERCIALPHNHVNSNYVSDRSIRADGCPLRKGQNEGV